LVDAALDDFERAVGPRLIEVLDLEQLDAELQGAQRLPPFVRRHTRELFETFALLGDGLRIQGDERFHRRLRQHIHGLVQPRHQHHACRWLWRDTEPVHFLQDEGDKDIAQHVILPQQLVQGGLLRVSERSQFAGLFEDGRIGSDRVRLGWRTYAPISTISAGM
jgi:hypothetical protein